MHISPTETVFGGGMWMPPPDALAKIRGSIAAKSQAWKKVLSDAKFAKAFDGVGGDALSRPPRGFAPEHPFIEDIKRKSFYAMREDKAKAAASPKFVDEVAGTYTAASPLVRYLCGALDVPF